MEERFEEAINAFNKAYQEDYKRIQSLDGIASSYYRVGNYIKAIEIYEAIQDEKGYDGKIWCDIGICYNAMDQCEKLFDILIRE